MKICKKHQTSEAIMSFRETTGSADTF